MGQVFYNYSFICEHTFFGGELYFKNKTNILKKYKICKNSFYLAFCGLYVPLKFQSPQGGLTEEWIILRIKWRRGKGKGGVGRRGNGGRDVSNSSFHHCYNSRCALGSNCCYWSTYFILYIIQSHIDIGSHWSRLTLILAQIDLGSNKSRLRDRYRLN